MDKDQGWCPKNSASGRCPCCLPLRQRSIIVNLLVIAFGALVMMMIVLLVTRRAENAKLIVNSLIGKLNINSSVTAEDELKSLKGELEINIKFSFVVIAALVSSIVVTSFVCPISMCISKRRPPKCFGTLFIWIIVHVFSTAALVYVWIQTLLVLVNRKQLVSPEISKSESLGEALSMSRHKTNPASGMTQHMVWAILWLLLILTIWIYSIFVYIKLAHYVVKERKDGTGGEAAEGDPQLENQANPPGLLQQPQYGPNYAPYPQNPNTPYQSAAYPNAPNPYYPNPNAPNPYSPNPNAPNPYYPNPNAANPNAPNPYAANPNATIPSAPKPNPSHPGINQQK